MRYCLLILWLLVFPLVAKAQTFKGGTSHGKHDIDSIIAFIDTTQSIPLKVKALNKLVGYDFITKKSDLKDSSKVFAQRAFTLAKKIEDRDGMAWASVNLSNINRRAGNMKLAYQHLQNAYDNFQLNKDSAGMGHSADLIATLYEKLNNMPAAIKARKEYLTLINPKKGIWYGYALESLGLQYQIKNNLDSSDYYLEQALEVIEEFINDSPEYPNIANNLGSITCYHLIKNDLDREKINNAETHLRRLEEFMKHVTDAHRFIRFYQIKAYYFGHLNQYDSGKYYIDLMLATSKQINANVAITMAYNNCAHFYEQMGAYEEALVLADSAIVGASKYQLILEEKKGRLAKMKAYEKLNQHDLALRESKRLAVLADSVLREENRLSSIDFEIRYEVDKKNQQLTFQEERLQLLNESNQANQKVKYWLVVAIGSLVLLIIVVFNRFKIKQKAETRLTEKNVQIEEKNEQINKANEELEKRLLRAQMNPHFVFNSLAAIQGFILENDRDSAITYLDKFSKLIRRVLDQTSSVMVPLSEEIKLLEYYIQLESLRFEDQFDHEIVIDTDVDQESTEIPFLLLQPYVENAIQHGFKFKKNKGKLEVILTREGESVVCSIKDNGVGREEAERMERDKLKDHKSVGMSVSARRLELINKQHKITTSVKITDLFEQDKAIGTLVEIRIPFHKKAA